MKKLITNYTFIPASKQIVFKDYTSISLASVLMITNVQSNLLIYNFVDPTAGGAVSGNVLTLDYNTTAQSASDPLQIWYDDTTNQPATQDGLDILQYLLEEIRFLSMTRDQVNGALRTVFPTGTTLPTVTTVGTVSSISSGTITTSQIGAGRSYDAQTLIPNTMQNLAIQSNIINVVVA